MACASVTETKTAAVTKRATKALQKVFMVIKVLLFVVCLKVARRQRKGEK